MTLNFFSKLNEDCFLHITSFLTGKEIKNFKQSQKYINIFLYHYADIIFSKIIENKYKFLEFNSSYLFKTSNKGISINKSNKINNKLDLLTEFNIT